MAQDYIEPIFTTELRRLLFLRRLWSVRTADRDITTQDVADWIAFKDTKPLPGTPDFRARMEAWREARCQNIVFFILSKWDSYRLGGVRPAAEAFLATRPNPNQTQAREAVRLQLIDKYADEVRGIDITTLTSLVSGLVW